MSLMVAGMLFAGSRGICHDRVKRPITRFIDFYRAADESVQPLSFWERVTYGLAIAAQEPPPPPACDRGA
jgi:hypothetical protein